MGCCYSTNKSSPPKKIPQISAAAKQSSISKSPPPTSPPHIEEETVKEVLSETPSSIPKPAKIESPFIKAAPLLRDFPRAVEHQNGVVFRKPFMAFGADDVSDLSEICSTHSESVSAATSATEKREIKSELREFRQMSPSKLKNRSFSGEMNRDRTVGRSPGRRPEPSPNRVRPASGSGYVRKRENGESSGRRSRSPVTRTDSGATKPGLERTQSGRKMGKSPGRVGSVTGERARRVNGGKESGDSKWPPTSSNELLENPLVSLECFIFL
ncbi:hypothetical protein ACS0TY_032075 [Phlomoides rotata]